MAHESKSQGTGSLRGFASMEQEKQREIAKKGGANVPHEKRSFAQDRTLAAIAGRRRAPCRPGGAKFFGQPRSGIPSRSQRRSSDAKPAALEIGRAHV